MMPRHPRNRVRAARKALALYHANLALTHSPARRLIGLEYLYGAQADANCIGLVLLCGLVIYLYPHADVASACGALLAVVGVLRYRRAYRDRIDARLKAQSTYTLINEDDRDVVCREREALFSQTERFSAWLVIGGTLLSGCAGLIWRLLALPV